MWCCKCTSQNSHTIVSPIIGWICRMFELHGDRKTLFASTYIHIILPFCMILIMQARNITKNQATLLSKSEHAWKSELGHMLVIFYYSLCQAVVEPADGVDMVYLRSVICDGGKKGGRVKIWKRNHSITDTLVSNRFIFRVFRGSWNEIHKY